MSNMSRNNSTTSLMGFSVHQPQLGAILEFFPAMGSQQLDDMIDAYIPGNMSILDKRTAVTMEFFEHSMTTGELFKFFMVYPAAAAESPASSLQDSGYGGSAFASPVVSEPRWSASTSKKARIGSTRGPAATAADFSHIPGMKIMTRDGQDVTNSASRGCKTKEQRDHAHLMRIMKACDSCKKKKIRCDPSHKRASIPVVADSKVKKASKKASSTARTIPASVPPIVAAQPSFDTSFDTFMPSFDVAEQDSWEQFVAYDDEDFMAAPTVDVNYDFFYDPAGHFSPSTSFASGFNSGSSSSSASPSQSFTPAQSAAVSANAGVGDGLFSKNAESMLYDAGLGDFSVPSVPFKNSDGFDSGDYVDFMLYSPESSGSSDDDLSSYSFEIKAASSSSSPEHVSRRGGAQVESRSVSRSGSVSSSPQAVSVSDAGVESRSAFAHMEQCGFDRGTSEGSELIGGERHNRRRRGIFAAQGGKEGYHGVVISHGGSHSGKPHVSESLVPRGPQDVPRPPDLQQYALASSGLSVRSPLAVDFAGATIPDVTRTATRSHTSHTSHVAATALAQSALGRERLDGSQRRVTAPAMNIGLDDLYDVGRQQPAATAINSGIITTIVNGKSASPSISRSRAATAHVTSTTSGGAQQTIAAACAENATIAVAKRSFQQNSSSCPVSSCSEKAPSGAVAADQYRDPGSNSLVASQVNHAAAAAAAAAASICGRAPLSSRHISSGSGSDVAQYVQQSLVGMPHTDGLVMALFVLAVLFLGLAQSVRVKTIATLGGSFFEMAAFLTLSAAAAAQKQPDLTKLRPSLAGPLKSSPTSPAGVSDMLSASLCNAQSTIASLTRRLGGQLGLPKARATASHQSRSAGFVSLR